MTDFFVQLAVGDAGNLGIIRLKNDGGLVRIAVFQVNVEAVVGNVELAILEPFIEWRIALIECLREGLVPMQIGARQSGPEAFIVSLGFGAQRMVGFHAGYGRVTDEFCWW